MKGGPALNAGIQAGDVIIEFNGKPVSKNDDLVQQVTATAARNHGAGEAGA